jgi:hypothetical protein
MLLDVLQHYLDLAFGDKDDTAHVQIHA